MILCLYLEKRLARLGTAGLSLALEVRRGVVELGRLRKALEQKRLVVILAAGWLIAWLLGRLNIWLLLIVLGHMVGFAPPTTHVRAEMRDTQWKTFLWTPNVVAFVTAYISGGLQLTYVDDKLCF
jgi:hypothetical protein